MFMAGSGYTSGDVRVDGFPVVHSSFARIAGYCEQFDKHASQTTVQEAVIFSANLRLSGLSAAATRSFADHVSYFLSCLPAITYIG